MFNFDNSYAQLPERFYAKVHPEKFSNPTLIAFNQDLANEILGLNVDTFNAQDLAEIFSAQRILPKSNPIALAYAGHQFGHFSPQLGDGRALLLGEILSPEGARFDIQLKGSGRTPFSRNGDGKSSLGPVIREYIVSEAMHFLGVPTTRALAAVSTGDFVYREQALPGGIFTRVACSHIRIGTFEYFAGQRDNEALEVLIRYSLDRHYPGIQHGKNIYLDFLQAVAHAQAALVAKWMSFGFIHGVMNTDNMSISGETLDYGPCAFMDNYAANRVFSSIDQNGRYAYNNQISIAQWNLYRLASCFLPFIHEDQDVAIKITEEASKDMMAVYEEKWKRAMIKKLGLFDLKFQDKALINKWLQLLEDEDLDFTLSFRKLSEENCDLKNNICFNDFFVCWKKRLKSQSQSFQDSIKLMNSVNPVFIPRNHQVERAIQLSLAGDYSVFKEMNELLKIPYIDQNEFLNYKEPPKLEERIGATFCGT
ncbi:UPF0061 protein YdiU [hydrothermal vent metagenome]|uniref:UPF0061 protein YdiU n=1 Tax=hydrothermal vent metagenome TaxID=652676 RepID=A0A3B1CWF9_9ZZZZ